MKTLPQVWHEGELQVQERAGVLLEAKPLTRGIRDYMPDSGRRFLMEQRFAVLSTVDTAGRVWATLLTGPEGFLDSPDEHTVSVKPSDKLALKLGSNDAGLIVIEFATRRRMRVNGELEIQPDGTMLIRTKQVYANCPQYIQAREVVAQNVTPAALPQAIESAALSENQQALIRRADTFFIATAHPEYGADASHRGGRPGFVDVHDAHSLTIPDYSGNNMFNTLGNIQANPRAGLLFIEFESSTTLQLTGTATIDWEPSRASTYRGAKRVVDFQIAEVIETMTSSARYAFLGYSPDLP